jgi:Eukaryotic aspartyl protease
MAALARNVTLDRFMFSIYIGESNETSDITFGGYDSFKIKKDDDEGYGIHWYEVELDQQFWALEVNEAAYGEYELYDGSEFLVVMDSGTQFIYLR